jgi:hypothetical protein
MQEINAEYDRLFPMFQSKSEVKNEQFETATEYKDVINKIIHLNVNIEICGIYVWVSGNTKPVKEVLKQAGFYWASHKMAW